MGNELERSQAMEARNSAENKKGQKVGDGNGNGREVGTERGYNLYELQ